jgi:hypothetical protein
MQPRRLSHNPRIPLSAAVAYAAKIGATRQQFVGKRSGGAVRRWKTARMLIYSGVDSAFYSAYPCASACGCLKIVPDDFIAVFRLARHPAERFLTNC